MIIISVLILTLLHINPALIRTIIQISPIRFVSWGAI